MTLSIDMTSCGRDDTVKLERTGQIGENRGSKIRASVWGIIEERKGDVGQKL